jgi:hypothetical protein
MENTLKSLRQPGSAMAGPAYLQHVGTRGQTGRRHGQSCTVVLFSSGRGLLPTAARGRLGLAHLPAEGDVVLGAVVVARDTGPLARRGRRGPACWAFTTRPDRGAGSASGRYERRSEAVESCAVEAIDGRAARVAFEGERWLRRRPSDN